MYRVDGLGAAQEMDSKLWTDMPGDPYQGGKFVREAYTDPETGQVVEVGEEVRQYEYLAPPVAGEAMAETLAQRLRAQYQTLYQGLKARGISVQEPIVAYECDDGMCVVRVQYVAPIRPWVSRQLFDNEAEAQAHAAETKAELEAAGWKVLGTDVSREETGWFHVLHEVDVSPLYLGVEVPGEGETISPPVITEEEEIVLPTASGLSRAQKIGLGVGLGLAGAVLVGGVVTVAVLKKREVPEPAMAGYGRRFTGRYWRP